MTQNLWLAVRPATIESFVVRQSDSVDSAPSADGQPGNDECALEDRGLYAAWYVRKRLEEELDRSRRAGHKLSVVVLGPSGEVSEAVLSAAASAVKRAARASDIVGWLDGSAIVVVMPDGDEEGSSHAAKRWAQQIWLKTMHLGAVKWQTIVINNVLSFASSTEVLNAARSGIRTVLAPRRW